MAVIQSGTQLWTYSDLVQYVCDTHDVSRSGLDERRARAAVQYAYRDLPLKHSWSYFFRQRLLQTVAEYSTGTVVYDHTGGASERMLTLTTGTWPDWAAYGRVIIDSVHYEVDTRVDGSIITLAESSNPGADVASTTYSIYRSAYPLPQDFHQLSGPVWDVADERPLHSVDPVQHHTALQVFYQDPDTPYHCTVRATGKQYGGMNLIFGPPPASARTYDVLYKAAPRRLAIDEYSAGTVAVSATATVTGTATVFPPNCVGSIIRISSGPIKPSNLMGSLDGTDNPFVIQGVIKTRTSDTVIVLEEAVTQTLSGVGYVISDPIDLEPDTMLTALQRMAEAEFSRLAGRKDAALKQGLARQAVIEAMEADSRVDNVPGNVVYNPFRNTTLTNDDA